MARKPLPTQEPAKIGRPTDYSLEFAARICEEVATGRKLVEICADEGMPNRATVYVWIGKYAEFNDMYTRAREERGDLYADEIVSIADTEEDANKARVRIDARKWAASKLNQKNYGEKIDISGNVVTKLDEAQLDARLALLIGKAGAIAASGGEGTQEGEA